MNITNKLMVIIIPAAVTAALGVIYYLYLLQMHNTILTAFVIADDKLIASDGRGPYRDGSEGVSYARDEAFYTRDEEGYVGYFNLNGSSRSVYVNFTHAPWKDANLRDVPSRLPSKDYYMNLIFFVIGYDGKPVDLYNMSIGEYLQYKSPQIQVQFSFNDFDTGQFAGIYVWQEPTINETGPSHDFTARIIYRYYRVWLPTKTPEPPQTLRDDSHMTLTRVSDEKWVLDVNAWFLTYYRAFYGKMLKTYVKLSLYLTISRYKAM